MATEEKTIRLENYVSVQLDVSCFSECLMDTDFELFEWTDLGGI